MAIVKCSCQNEWQDKEYGKNLRVANKTAESPTEKWRCTVCEKEVDKSQVVKA